MSKNRNLRWLILMLTVVAAVMSCPWWIPVLVPPHFYTADDLELLRILKRAVLFFACISPVFAICGIGCYFENREKQQKEATKAEIKYKTEPVTEVVIPEYCPCDIITPEGRNSVRMLSSILVENYSKSGGTTKDLDDIITPEGWHSVQMLGRLLAEHRPKAAGNGTVLPKE